jgi:hypothetical protein
MRGWRRMWAWGGLIPPIPLVGALGLGVGGEEAYVGRRVQGGTGRSRLIVYGTGEIGRTGGGPKSVHRAGICARSLIDDSTPHRSYDAT